MKVSFVNKHIHVRGCQGLELLFLLKFKKKGISFSVKRTVEDEELALDAMIE
jgi:hypothetical protein